MAGGVGPCRFGYYAQVQREILIDLGCRLKFFVLEPPDTGWGDLLRRIKELTGNRPWRQVFRAFQLAWAKAQSVDQLERLAQKYRAVARQPEQVEKIYSEVLQELDRENARKNFNQLLNSADSQLQQLSQREQPLLRVALVGEIYTVIEPFVNLNLEKILGRLGVEVTRSLYIGEWMNLHLFRGWLGSEHPPLDQLAKPYLNSFVGGHGRETVGSAVYYAREKFDGLIQVAPLTCMPEIVAEAILPQVSNATGMPVLTLFVDEQAGEAGIVTRIEAFVDLMLQRRQERKISS